MNSGSASGAAIRIGIVGLDTSHSVAFSRILNDTSAPDHVPGGRVVAAVKTFSPDIPASAARVEEHTGILGKRYGVELVPGIEELSHMVDAVMIESLDGRAHLAQVRAVLAAKKPIFIDKPLAANLRDVLEVFRLAAEVQVPVFTSSAYRFHESLVELKRTEVGEIRAAISYGPAYLEPHHPDLFYYGIHPAEALFAVIGLGCESVVRSHTPDSDVVTGTWKGGRLGVLHGLRTGAIPHRVVVFGSTGFAEQIPTDERFNTFGSAGPERVPADGDSYASLVRQILTFFRTGSPPVSADETIELFAFLEAAEESKRRGGQPVTLCEVLKLAGN